MVIRLSAFVENSATVCAEEKSNYELALADSVCVSHKL